MKQPVDHIIRPQLPWRRDAGITECGYDATAVSAISRDDYFARLKDLGQQRTAMLTCMTCATTARNWETWATDPRKAIGREVQWETAWRGQERGDLLRHELNAVAALIEAHRDEFDAAVERGQRQQEWNTQKAAAKQRQRAKPHPTGGL